MELSCDRYQEPQDPVSNVLNLRARAFTPRRAAVAAAERIKDIARQDEQLS